MLRFILELPNGAAISEETVLRRNNERITINTEDDLRKFIFLQWCKENKVKSFEQWASEVNEDENYEGGFTADDARENLASLFNLNISGKYVNLYDFFKGYNYYGAKK